MQIANKLPINLELIVYNLGILSLAKLSHRCL